MLMVQPAEDEKLKASPPREIVFLVDVSGSMSGQPTAKCIQAMQEFLKLCKGEDTVQVITFANDSHKLFEKPVPVNEENIKRALNFTQGLEGGGGTEMLKGIKLALDEPPDPKRVRIIVMLTDGFIGNEAEIIAEVGRRAGDRIRFWCIGIGQSPNRFLLDGVAKQGGGMSKVLELGGDSKSLALEVMQRIHRAQLAGVNIDWAGLKIFETYPAKLPELWADRPLIVYGLFEPSGAGMGKEATIRVNGKVEGEAASWPVAIFMPAKEPANEVLSKVWARQKIEDLMQQTYYAGSPAVEEVVTGIALEYRLMSQYTSFVAVDASDAAKLREPARPPRRMLVPVPIPEGTRYEGFFGPAGEEDRELTEFADAPLAAHSIAYAGAGYAAAPAAPPPSPAGMAPTSMPTPVMVPPAKAPATAMPREASQGGRGKYKPGAGTAIKNEGLALSGANAYGLTLNGGFSESEPKDSDALAMTGGTYKLIGGEDIDRIRQAEGRALGLVGQAFSAQQAKVAKQAQEALGAAKELAKKEAWTEARAKFTQAVLLDNASGGGADVSDEAVAGAEKAGEELVKIYKKQVPELDKTLSLVIRDQPVGDALQAVAKAADLKINLASGSTDDAAALLGVKEVRVTYLDLRGPTAAQALDWILTPLRMTWDVKKNLVDVTTTRRESGGAAWVYDVSLMALPTESELKAAGGDYSKQVAVVTKAADAFMAAVRKGLGAKEDAVVWYGPGQLLVIGDPGLHAKAAKLLADLADPKAKLEGDLAALQKVTAARAEGRKDDAAKLQAVGERIRTAQSMAVHSWQLLAASARGELDLEALTELQVAWRRTCRRRDHQGQGGAAGPAVSVGHSGGCPGAAEGSRTGRPGQEGERAVQACRRCRSSGAGEGAAGRAGVLAGPLRRAGRPRRRGLHREGQAAADGPGRSEQPGPLPAARRLPAGAHQQGPREGARRSARRTAGEGRRRATDAGGPRPRRRRLERHGRPDGPGLSPGRRPDVGELPG